MCVQAYPKLPCKKLSSEGHQNQHLWKDITDRMEKAMLAWIRKVLGMSPPALETDPNSASRTVYVDKQGRETRLKEFASVANARKALDSQIKRQTIGARRKLRDPSHWGPVGQIELAAINQSLALIKAIPTSTKPSDFSLKAYEILDSLASSFRSNNYDVDGYGLGTIQEIKRVLEDPTAAATIIWPHIS
jgi:hypothetical protein